MRCLIILLLLLPLRADDFPAAVGNSPVLPTFSYDLEKMLFTCVAQGTPPLTYQWHRNGKPIANATRPEIILGRYDTGTYHCAVTNPAGTLNTPTFRIATTTVADAPEVTITSKRPLTTL